MHLKKFLPHRALRPFVKFYWYLEPDYGSDKQQRLLPCACCDIIIQIGPPATYKLGSDEWHQRKPVGFVEGHFTRHCMVRFVGACWLAGIRFTSTGLYPFVKTPVREFTEEFADLTTIFGRDGKELVEKVAETDSAGGIPDIFDSFLLSRIEATLTEKDAQLEEAVQKLLQKRGRHSVGRLAGEMRMPERRLERLFNRQVGISPERFANSLRLNYFIKLCHQPNRPTFTALAYECGFADQSHLIRTFKKHTGLTPRQYFKEQHAIQTELNEQTFD